ncbi:ATP-binding cassette domain-containing protein [Methanococcus maripaludis]|uniref:Molybdate/tungstate import ATP-binding protein WtpC n=1 Tax=Methanococcus maripaludis TaxID=39152 RepID=A0A8T4H2Q7_METMI|nr:ATP-binding cassette domain-containing protein [Methanococcus maripaludis]MBM7409559.1 molybdate/tungstate transport system ATP-binding protein [Methanococcus maripaludis]MBP2219689.1 molybdate/tungstate transport system ATP-binding protein [Methanococcus maripaludis]
MLKLENVCKSWKEFQLKNVNLEIGNNYCILLGPSGAGKSVIIQCITGILKPDSGKIYFNGEDITEMPPEKRNFGYVPQNYALFPNMNVYNNIAYGMKLRKYSKAEIEKKVMEISEFLHISHILDRKPTTLSGGEQQRVAIARALVLDPKILLLDEPTSALDTNIKESVISELKKIGELVPVIHITHDFVEAKTLGNQIAILINGELNDFGNQGIFKTPKNEKIANFLGYNIISNNEETFAVAPEEIVVKKSLNDENDESITGTVESLVDFGYYKKVTVNIGDTAVKTITDGENPVNIGDTVSIKYQRKVPIN